MSESRRIKVLYLGAGAPHITSSGMDLVSRIHLDELVTAPLLEVAGFVVSAGSMPLEEGPFLGSVGEVSIIAADPVRSSSRPKLALTKAIYALTRCGAMFSFSFRSSLARDFIHEALAPGRYDIVIVDHFNTLANISLHDLKKSRAKIVFIVHDIMPSLLREIGRLKHRRYKTALSTFEAWKAACVERWMLKLASVTVFLSDYDLHHYQGASTRSMVLLPMPAADDAPPPERLTDRTLLFTGSPSYLPNAIAIDWLKDQFARLLYQSDPSIKIVLAGKGTEAIGSGPGNVDALGFVSRTKLTYLMDRSIAVICPIAHGGGIKIKVLEALARGCLVFGTTDALRGFEQFLIEPVIAVSDPAGSVERVVQLCRDPGALADMRTQLAARWQRYSSAKKGNLARVIELVAQTA
jgi:glycosyltransferase involved in cell wall biosynthesis